MSVFGGSASDSPYEPEESDLSQSFPSDEDIARPRRTRRVPNLSEPSHLDIDARQDTLSLSDEAEDSPPSRSNRFTGSRQTWKGYTAGDRQIAASLEQIQNSDLAAHLYNAHALKRRSRRSDAENAGLEKWKSRQHWLKSEREREYTDAWGLTQKELVPSNDWTAWPLHPKQIPTVRDQSRYTLTGSRPDEWAIGGAKKRDPGEDLREEMLAVFQRLAKDKWVSREAGNDEAEKDHADAYSSREESLGPSRSQSKSAAPNQPHASASQTCKRRQKSIDISQSKAPKRRGRKPDVNIFTHPTILTDDAHAQRLMQPTINSMLSKVDDLAMAVRRTRLNHLRYGVYDDMTSCSEYTTDVGTDRSRSRSSFRGRSKTSRKRSKSAASREKSAGPSQPPSAGSSIIVKNKLSKNMKEASDSDVVMQSASDSAHSKSTMRSRRRRRSASIPSNVSTASTRGRLQGGLMDWSEVVGLAAVKGWNTRALARTAQRCASLFGESMSFIPMHENSTSYLAPKEVQFTPSTISAPNALSIPRNPLHKRPFFPVGTLRCPHKGCWGHEKEFPVAYRVVEHCMKHHGYDPRTNNPDNEQENKLGGVHVDGFLQPITLKRGWVGKYRGKAKKKMKAGDAKEPVAVDVVSGVEDQASQ